MYATELLIYPVIWLLCGVVCYMIAKGRGATNLFAWTLVGILFGPIGVLLAMLGARGQGRTDKSTALADLQVLANLRQSGALTEEEYQAKKAGLMGRI